MQSLFSVQSICTVRKGSACRVMTAKYSPKFRYGIDLTYSCFQAPSELSFDSNGWLNGIDIELNDLLNWMKNTHWIDPKLVIKLKMNKFWILLQLACHTSPRTNEEVMFNNMLRSARNPIECAFGHLKVRWQIYNYTTTPNLKKRFKVCVLCNILHSIYFKSLPSWWLVLGVELRLYVSEDSFKLLLSLGPSESPSIPNDNAVMAGDPP